VINQVPDKLNNHRNDNIIHGIKWINIDQIGLSRSRNLGIDISTSEYVYLTDDDIVIDKKFEQIIEKQIIKFPETDIFAFQVSGINENFKKYPTKIKNIGFLRSLKLSSVQLIMKTQFIKENNLYYDELFGTGSKYKMGEENIFVFDALKKGAKIRYIPYEIAKVYIGESSWFTGYNKKYFFDRGAIFYLMFRKFSYIYSLSFCIRKRKLYNKQFGIKTAFSYMMQGKTDYKRNKKIES